MKVKSLNFHNSGEIRMPTAPGAPRLTDWTKADPDIFTTNGSVSGYCNVDPTEAYGSKVKFKQQCDCKYDGLWGQFCEVPVESVCALINAQAVAIAVVASVK